CPTGMIFVPCRGGVSHNPIEYSSPEGCAIGTQVLLGAVFRYDRLRKRRDEKLHEKPGRKKERFKEKNWIIQNNVSHMTRRQNQCLKCNPVTYLRGPLRLLTAIRCMNGQPVSITLRSVRVS